MSGDKVALVTGTSAGIGAAVAAGLLADGWRVIGLSRRRPEISDPNYEHFTLDLAHLDELNAFSRERLEPLLADARWRRAGLVNNAGAIGMLDGLEAIDPLEAAEVFAVNAIAPIFLMGFLVRACGPSVTLRIVNLSTGAAVQPATGLGDYGSSKAALRHAGMTLAAELSSEEHPGGPRRNVAILSYAPGVVDTAMQEAARNHGPWSKRFVNFQRRGLLQPPDAPAREVVEFLGGDHWEGFTERRYGAG